MAATSSSDTTEEGPDFRTLKPRLDDLSEKDLRWARKYGHPIGTDETDASSSDAGTGDGTVTLHKIGRFFKGETHYAWFVHTDVNADEKFLGELFAVLKIVSSKDCKPLHIHCIDYDLGGEGSQFSADNVDKLRTDFKSLLHTTVGIVLTWSGLTTSIVHKALEDVNQETKLFSVVTPSWNDVPVEMQTEMTERDVVDVSNQSRFGDQISQRSNHFLLLDHGTSPEITRKQKQRDIRHFQFNMIKAMESDENEMPVVCVLFNGLDDALKMVLFALEKEVPVLVVEGSGGYADTIAKIYWSADIKVAKERKKDGKIYTRYKRVPKKTEENDDLMKNKRLSEVCCHLDMITVYRPGSRQTLDLVIFKALLKHEQPQKFKALVQMMQHVKEETEKKRSNTGNAAEDFETTRATFIEMLEQQMNFFITALKQKSADMVEVFLTELKLSDELMEYFSLRRVLQLYNDHNLESEEEKAMKDIRDSLAKKLKTLTCFPLRCRRKDCLNCDSTDTLSDRPKFRRTCLHPVQELFLWSLYQESVDLALVFWKRCNDKIVAALFAQKIFRLLAEEKKNPDDKWHMDEGANQFMSLAIDTLESCHQMDEMQTERLLTKPCSWWGDVSVLQMAIITENREFMKQTACRNVADRIWKGQPPINPDTCSNEKEIRLTATGLAMNCSLVLEKCAAQKQISIEPCQFVDTDETGKCCFCCNQCGCMKQNKCFIKCKNFVCSPRFKFGLSLISQLVFLVLFSGVLLFDLHHGFTPYCIVLTIWVSAIFLEEVRQTGIFPQEGVREFSVRDPVIKHNDTARRRTFRAYFGNYWNWVDVITIILFVIGVVLIVTPPGQSLQIFFGQLTLCVDFMVFSMRIFQMLIMLSDELGLMVIMVYEMLNDTKNFMVILLIFVLSYAVVSESLLYKDNEISWERVYNLPRKAYWQVFGELNLEEIEEIEGDNCSLGNNSTYFGNDLYHCPSEHGSSFVPFILGVYILMTNVLLLNLLIARFGVTFNKVLDKASTYQSWHRCQVTIEYYGRPILPPPINLFCIICEFLSPWLNKAQCCSRNPPRPQGRSTHNRLRQRGRNGESYEMTSLNNQDVNSSRVKVTRSSDGYSMDICWDNSIQTFGPEQSPYYIVSLCKIDREATVTPAKLKYRVGCRKDNRSTEVLTVWDLEPNYSYTVKVGNEETSDEGSQDTKQMLRSEELRRILAFENCQMQWVLDKEKAIDPVITELKRMSDITKAKFERIPEIFVQEMSQLRTDVKDRLTESIGKKSVKEALQTYQDNIIKIVKNWLEQHAKDYKAELDTKQQLMETSVQKLEELIEHQQQQIQQQQELIDQLGLKLCTQEQLMEKFMEQQQEVLQQQQNVLQQQQEVQLQQVVLSAAAATT